MHIVVEKQHGCFLQFVRKAGTTITKNIMGGHNWFYVPKVSRLCIVCVKKILIEIASFKP
jgi:hypothetical protein